MWYEKKTGLHFSSSIILKQKKKFRNKFILDLAFELENLIRYHKIFASYSIIENIVYFLNINSKRHFIFAQMESN